MSQMGMYTGSGKATAELVHTKTRAEWNPGGDYWRSAPATGMCGRLAGLGYSTQWFTLHEIWDLGRTEQTVASTGMCVGWYR